VLACIFIPWNALALLSFNALITTLNFLGTWEPNQVLHRLKQHDQVIVTTPRLCLVHLRIEYNSSYSTHVQFQFIPLKKLQVTNSRVMSNRGHKTIEQHSLHLDMP